MEEPHPRGERTVLPRVATVTECMYLGLEVSSVWLLRGNGNAVMVVASAIGSEVAAVLVAVGSSSYTCNDPGTDGGSQWNQDPWRSGVSWALSRIDFQAKASVHAPITKETIQSIQDCFPHGLFSEPWAPFWI